METESILLTDRNVLICLDEHFENTDDHLEYIKSHFCGKVIKNIDQIPANTLILFLTGNIEKLLPINAKQIFVVREISYNFVNPHPQYTVISVGQVPININNVGVYFRNCFDPTLDYFNLISTEHQFQQLTESNKGSKAFRTGIYITKVHGEENMRTFNLLRCSSNFTGPTDNTRCTDDYVIGKANEFAKMYFDQSAEMNHVLAQIYNNHYVDTGYDEDMPNTHTRKEKKAVIKAHSDKTKDMPRNALMAFCTFYKDFSSLQQNVRRSRTDPYDFCYNDVSVLTRLRFKLKHPDKYPNLIPDFDITLYPNSMFIMSLSSNRLYTHEIVASPLPIDKLPTRLGYVIRCSKTPAIYVNNATHIKVHDSVTNSHVLAKLNIPTPDDMVKIKELYWRENTTDEMVEYGTILFSMNEGDYTKPII